MDILSERNSNIWAKVYIRNDDIVSRNIIGETILVPIRGNLADMQQIYTLNNLGAFIWEQLNGKKVLADTRNAVLDNFESEHNQVETDILEFIEQIHAEGLIKEITD